MIKDVDIFQAYTNGGLSRSLSESDLSELCGASVSAPSPDDLAHRSLPPSDDEEMQFNNDDENENTGSGGAPILRSNSRHHVPETTSTRARTTSLQGPLSLSPSLPPELPPKKSRKHLPPPPPPSQSVRSRPALPPPAPSHGQYYQQRHQQPGGCNGNGSNSDAITTPMHAWPNSSSSNNGFIGSSSHNKRQTSLSSSSSTSSSTLAREDRAPVKQQFTLPETFVDEGVSFVRFATSKNNSLYPVSNINNGNNNNNLNRSASSVTSRTKAKAPIAKPVRRSKSQLVQPRNYVTSIQHGGAVTLVSLSSDSSSSSGHSDRFLTTQHVHHHHHFVEQQEDLELEWHRGKTEIPAFQVNDSL